MSEHSWEYIYLLKYIYYSSMNVLWIRSDQNVLYLPENQCLKDELNVCQALHGAAGLARRVGAQGARRIPLVVKGKDACRV
jgi:hypothetical protein